MTTHNFKHNYAVTFADGTFFTQESNLEFQDFIEHLEDSKWMIPKNDQKICFNMKMIVKVGVLR